MLGKKGTIFVIIILLLLVNVLTTFTVLNATSTGKVVGTLSLTVVSLEEVAPPENFNCTIIGNDTFLNWSDVTGATGYRVYFSSNISQIMTLNLSNIGPQVAVVNVSASNYTDNNATDNQTRYYSVSAINGAAENLTQDRQLGKIQYIYTAPVSSSFGTLASNRMVVYLNKSFNANSILADIPSGLNPTISRLARTNASGEFFVTHVKGLADGNDFGINISEAYQISVDKSFNHTICGQVAQEPYIITYKVVNSTSKGALQSNFRGIYEFNKTYNAESFLQEIPGSLSPTISRLDKSNASGEFLTTHVRGLADGNNYTLEVGRGYVVTVNAGHTQTLCTNCFN